MPVTMKQVLDALLPDEPEYREAAARLGPDALPLLRQLVQGDNLELATKAASMAGHIQDPQAASVVSAAAASPLPSVRVAAAAAARHLSSQQASRVLATLVADTDAGVRKVAMKAVPADPDDQLRAAVARAAPAISEAQATSAVAEPAAVETEGPQYPMVDPLEVSGPPEYEPAGGLDATATPGETTGDEPSYPAAGADEAPPGVDAPPGAPGY
jgi:hypothetical protein